MRLSTKAQALLAALPQQAEVDPLDARIVYYGTSTNPTNTGGTLWRSLNAGVSWTDISRGDGVTGGLHVDTHWIAVSRINPNVLFTANDAHVRDLRLQIPRDCVASESRAATKLALQYFQDVLDADVKASARIRLAAARKVGRGRAARRAARMRAAHRN